MKQKRIILIGIIVLASGPNLPAGSSLPKDNPYAKAIVGGNVFSLNPPPTPPVVVPPPRPLAEIRLQGVTTINRRGQVLVKVRLPSQPPQPPKEVSYVLSEGERQGEIEVLEINVESGTVKFSNHGTVQTLNLARDAEKPAPDLVPVFSALPGR